MMNQESASNASGIPGSSEDPRIDAYAHHGRLMTLFLPLVCTSSVVVSYLVYYVFTPANDKATYNALVNPQRPIPAGLMVRGEHGAEVLLASLKDKWLMVSADGSICSNNCTRKPPTMRQLHIGQGPDRDRVVPIWLVTDREEIDPRLVKAYNDDYGVVRFLHVPDLPKNWPAGDETLSTDHLFLVSPFGNLIIQFPRNSGPKKVRTDMTWLLKYSRVGWAMLP